MNKEKYLLKLGKHITQIRINKNLTQAELAYRCDKDMQSISRLERGKINPSIYYLKQLADALNAEVWELLNFKY